MPVSLPQWLPPDLRRSLSQLNCPWPPTDASVRKAFYARVRCLAEDDNAGLLVLVSARDTVERALDLGLPGPPGEDEDEDEDEWPDEGERDEDGGLLDVWYG
jgi:hypothetical protein